MSDLISKAILGFCGWELLPLAAIVLLAAHFVRRRRRFREQEARLRESICSYEAALGTAGSDAGRDAFAPEERMTP